VSRRTRAPGLSTSPATQPDVQAKLPWRARLQPAQAPVPHFALLHNLGRTGPRSQSAGCADCSCVAPLHAACTCTCWFPPLPPTPLAIFVRRHLAEFETDTQSGSARFL